MANSVVLNITGPQQCLPLQDGVLGLLAAIKHFRSLKSDMMISRRTRAGGVPSLEAQLLGSSLLNQHVKLYHEQRSPNLADASRGLLTELFSLQRAIAWQPRVCSKGLDGPVRVRLTARYYATLHTGRGWQQCFHISSSASLHSISQIHLTLLYTGHFGSEACALGSTSHVLFPAAKPNHTSRAFSQAVDIDNCI